MNTTQMIIDAAMQHRITTDEADRALDIAMRVEKLITCAVTGKVMDSRKALGIFDADDANRCLAVMHEDAISEPIVQNLLTNNDNYFTQDASDVFDKIK